MKSFPQSETLKRLPNQFFADLMKTLNTYREQGYDVINLGQGNPDQPTPEHIVQSLQNASENPDYHKYPPFKGYDFLKEAVADFYKREYDVEVDPTSEVAIMLGSKAGLVELSQCFLDPGDVALVPDPGYPDYWSGVAIADAVMKSMPLLQENDFLPDYEQLDNDTLDKAKLMFLNYPNNPSGAVASEEFFKETIDLADKHDICVVHDFAYGAIGFDEHKKPLSFLQMPGAKDVGVEIYTMSKTYNMAGWRVAFAVGNPSVVEALELIQDHYHVSLFGALQEATATALLEPQDSVRELRQTYEERRDILAKGFEELGWDLMPCKGSFFVWLKVPEGYSSQSFADALLDQVGLFVAPGVGFGTYGEGYVRIGLNNSKKDLKESISRFKEFQKKESEH